ncbi:MAG: hypothetical protein WBD40_21825 [Tepidisphaeraceae bacterium]
MEQDELEFDDPGLKDVVRRAWGSEVGPQRLRGRISHLIATAGSIDLNPAGAARATIDWQSRIYALAAAAVIVFAIGLLTLYYQGVFERSPSRAVAMANPVPVMTAVPTALGQSMIERHDACLALRDHHLVDQNVPKNYGALNVKLTADLGFPSLARSIGADWTFKGAGTCDVGALRGSHLLFARGDQSVSLFSLPTHCMAGAPAGSVYAGVVGNHPMAGFARGGGVYSVVGSSPTGSLSLEAIVSIRDGLLGLFDPGGCSGETGLEFE